jgi:hypothetical protein
LRYESTEGGIAPIQRTMDTKASQSSAILLS